MESFTTYRSLNSLTQIALMGIVVKLDISIEKWKVSPDNEV